jgi:hypothetical protein
MLKLIGMYHPEYNHFNEKLNFYSPEVAFIWKQLVIAKW